MAIRVSVISTPKNRISINDQDRKEIRTVGIAARSGVNRLIELSDVDGNDADNNETLVYDENTNKFVVKVLPIIDGGTY